MRAVCLALFSAPVASGFQFLGQREHKAYSDEISAVSAEPEKLAPSFIAFDTTPHQEVESNRQFFTFASDVSTSAKRVILAKVAKSIADDKRGFFGYLNQTERTALATRVAREEDTSFIDVVAPPSPMSRPVLVPPRMQSEGKASFLESGSSGSGDQDMQPLAEFQDTMADRTETSTDSRLPWGVGSPRTGDSLPNFHYANMFAVDVPKEQEYSLDSGDNIQSFSTAQQDVKLITQVLENVTNGFFLDTNAGNGEHPSNTLLLELLGWRGLLMEPRGYHYLDLWSKMRKAWLFLGCMSPHANATKIGFDADGDIDMLHGHKMHAYTMRDFMAEMGGRTTVDFWNLQSGGYEAEILNETLLGVGKGIEIGVILVGFDGRSSGRGDEWFVQQRSTIETEEVIAEIMSNASFKFIGGLDPYWINKVNPRFVYKDQIFVNPAYFQKRGIPTPTAIKSSPPPPITAARPGYDSWDSGFDYKQEVSKVMAYVKKAKAKAKSSEPMAKAHRIAPTKLVS